MRSIETELCKSKREMCRTLKVCKILFWVYKRGDVKAKNKAFSQLSPWFLLKAHHYFLISKSKKLQFFVVYLFNRSPTRTRSV